MTRPDSAGSADLLAAIVAATRRIVDVRRDHEPLGDLARRAESRPSSPGRLATALARDQGVRVIAECKRRSPSRGVLRAAYDPVSIARSYRRAGAVAVSVLTEPTFFDGSLGDLAAVTAAVDLPVLRKDFIVSDYQLFEARAAGAAAVLLIVAALDGPSLRQLLREATNLSLDALVEVHDECELDTALEAGAAVIGVNNRNLRTLDVDVGASERLIPRIPERALAISESGLKTAADLVRLRRLGYSGFLIGERLMLAPDPGAALTAMLREADDELAGPDGLGCE